MDALISSGLDLDQLGTVFGQSPQTIDTLQKLFAAGGNEIEDQKEGNGNNVLNLLLNALTSSGLDLNQLGTVFGQLPQTIDSLQKMFASGGNENEGNGNNLGSQLNPLLNALGLDGLNLDDLGTVLQKLPQTVDTLQKLFASGGIENFAGILTSLQEKVQERFHSTELANTCPLPEPIDIFLFNYPFEAYEHVAESVDSLDFEDHQEIPSEGTRDEL